LIELNKELDKESCEYKNFCDSNKKDIDELNRSVTELKKENEHLKVNIY
jgi:cell division FtsZ-interacting protein ZapD